MSDVTFWEHLFKCGCRHTTQRKKHLAEVCIEHGCEAIRITKVAGEYVTVKTLDGRGIKAQCKEQVSP